jgi:cation:H+ antiporter
MDAATLGPFLLGLVMLVGGAELLVRGASRLAAAAGLSPLLIGLTVVAWGTSAPEAATSTAAALAGQADIALGNVVGSNVFNVLLILGVSALVTPLPVAHKLVRVDVPALVAVSLGAWVLCLDGRVSRLDGLLLLAGLVAYTAFSVRLSRREPAAAQTARALAPPGPGAPPRRRLPTDVALVALGLAALATGSRWLVDGAVEIARLVGLSELIIGLTIVAAGTSLPEVAASVLASLRGERDIAIGNVVGSNLFNLLGVLGAAAAIAPAGVEVSQAALRFDLPVMVATSVACLPVFFVGGRIERWEGGFFLGYYAAYTAFLILDATDHDAAPAFSGFMLAFVVPLTLVTFAIVAWRSLRARTPAATTE